MFSTSQEKENCSSRTFCTLKNVCYLFRIWENSIPIWPNWNELQDHWSACFPIKVFIVPFISQLPQNKECECLGFLDWDIRSLPFIQRDEASWYINKFPFCFIHYAPASVMFIHLWGICEAQFIYNCKTEVHNLRDLQGGQPVSCHPAWLPGYLLSSLKHQQWAHIQETTIKFGRWPLPNNVKKPWFLFIPISSDKPYRKISLSQWQKR